MGDREEMLAILESLPLELTSRAEAVLRISIESSGKEAPEIHKSLRWSSRALLLTKHISDAEIQTVIKVISDMIDKEASEKENERKHKARLEETKIPFWQLLFMSSTDRLNYLRRRM